MTIKVNLITPEKLALSDEVDSIVVPAEDGELGILPHHAALLAHLGPGEIRLKKGSGETHLAISGGFVEVREGCQVEIFAETAEAAGEINIERARQAAERAQQTLQSATPLSEDEIGQAETALQRALVRLKVAEARVRQAARKDYH